MCSQFESESRSRCGAEQGILQFKHNKKWLEATVTPHESKQPMAPPSALIEFGQLVERQVVALRAALVDHCESYTASASAIASDCESHSCIELKVEKHMEDRYSIENYRASYCIMQYSSATVSELFRTEYYLRISFIYTYFLRVLH